MPERILGRAAKFAAAILAITAITAIMAGAASAITYAPIYKNIPTPLPGNTPSQAFQAQQASEFGGQVEVSGASANNTRVTVAMSSWACQSGTWNEKTCATTPGAKFSHPVTLKIYLPNPDNSVGPKIAQLTQTFKMPYRPSANMAKCPSSGGWYQKGKCYSGKLFKIVFPLKGVYLSENAIISVAHNTSGYGPEPEGYGNPCNSEPQGCPYDSLNVGVEDGFNPPTPGPTVGGFPLPDGAYFNSVTPGNYCDGGVGGAGIFRLDLAPGCWTGFQPMFEVTTG